MPKASRGEESKVLAVPGTPGTPSVARMNSEYRVPGSRAYAPPERADGHRVGGTEGTSKYAAMAHPSPANATSGPAPARRQVRIMTTNVLPPSSRPPTWIAPNPPSSWTFWKRRRGTPSASPPGSPRAGRRRFSVELYSQVEPRNPRLHHPTMGTTHRHRARQRSCKGGRGAPHRVEVDCRKAARSEPGSTFEVVRAPQADTTAPCLNDVCETCAPYGAAPASCSKRLLTVDTVN